MSQDKPVIIEVNKDILEGEPIAGIKWDEYDISSESTIVNNRNGYNEVAKKIKVRDSSIFKRLDIVRNMRSSETYQITEVKNNRNIIMVIRSIGSDHPQVINDKDILLRIGSPHIDD